MKGFVRAAALLLCICFAVGAFTGCGIIKRLDGEEEEINYCEAGGSVNFPEGFNPVGAKNTLETVMLDSTLVFPHQRGDRHRHLYRPGCEQQIPHFGGLQRRHHQLYRLLQRGAPPAGRGLSIRG